MPQNAIISGIGTKPIAYDKNRPLNRFYGLFFNTGMYRNKGIDIFLIYILVHKKKRYCGVYVVHLETFVILVFLCVKFV